MIRRPPRSTQGVSSAASDVYKRQGWAFAFHLGLMTRLAAVSSGNIRMKSEEACLAVLAAWATVFRKVFQFPTLASAIAPYCVLVNEGRKGWLLRPEPVRGWPISLAPKSMAISLIRNNDPSHPEISRAQVAVSSGGYMNTCLLYTSPSPRDGLLSRMPSSA